MVALGFHEVADFDVVRAKHVRGLEEFLAFDVGGFFFFAVREPASRNSSSMCLMPLSSKICFISFRLRFLSVLGKIGVPDAQAIESHSSGGFGARSLHIPRTIFMIRVRFSAAPCESPVRAEQIQFVAIFNFPCEKNAVRHPMPRLRLSQ